MLRDFNSYDWFTLSLILIGIGLLFLKQVNAAKYRNFLKLLYSKTYFKVKVRETGFISTFENIAFIIANIIASQLVYIFMIERGSAELFFENPLINLACIFMAISVFLFLKYHLEKLINYCYSNHNFLNIYLFYKQAIWSYAVFLALPLLTFFVYYPHSEANFLAIIITISGVYYLLNMVYFLYKNRSFAIRNWYYFILYLCALEIAPYYFLYNLFVIA